MEIDGLTKVYGGRPRKPAVEAIASLDLQVDPGEFLVVVGPSGCGKSTLLKVVAGLLEPTSGVVRVHGRTVTGPVRDLGVVFQQPVLLPWRSALDNVLLPLELMGRDPDLEAGRARELLGEVGLSGFEGRTPGELSGGMQQRVALCRALINDPALLLMDEPFSALDEFTRESLNDQLLALWDSARKTVVYVTHSIGEAVYLADRVAVMTARPGELAALVEVPLPRPRVPEHRYDQAFVETSRRIREAMRS